MQLPGYQISEVAAQITPQSAHRALIKAGFTVFSGGPHDLTLFGIRSTSRKLGEFDDLICALYQGTGGVWQLAAYPGTTDPGLYYSQQKLLNPKGVAILKGGRQYRGAWKLGKHRGKYPALVQVKPVTVIRDGNRDDMRDAGPDATEQTGLFGINIHRASASQISSSVGRWSAGCQVLQNPADYTEWLALLRRSAESWGTTFSYGILTQPEITAALAA